MLYMNSDSTHSSISEALIVLNAGCGRRFAYTDRVDGYLELDKDSCLQPGQGYFRGPQALLRDLFVSADGADLYRHNAASIDVRPAGFTVKYDCADLEVSLLTGEQAFSFACTIPPSVRSGSPVYPALVFPAASEEWFSCQDGGIQYWQNGAGVAIGCSDGFEIEDTGDGSVVLITAVPGARFYLVFEADDEAARVKILRLVRTQAVQAHRAAVFSFLEQVRLQTGDAAFDSALVWARFSAWMLVTNDYGPGIWAGLPWFRDNWGRDTFIALSGTLLVSGCYDEARAVITRFAGCQNRDKASSDYGRIPNRYCGPDNVIFNTADGTLWFIRAVWEYLQYSGDLSILDDVRDAIWLALDSDSSLRTDEHGFLKHGDADTWMDARIRGDQPWSARGDRACDIQALWFTALRIGAKLAHDAGETERAERWNALADKTAASFVRFFWSDDYGALADRLPQGAHGEHAPDFRVRPNQLFALTVPAVLDKDADHAELLPSELAARVVSNVTRELLTPRGLCSLSPDDPVFHPHHENPDWYHKDAAYHNGTIWVWNTGPWVTAVFNNGDEAERTLAWSLLGTQASWILNRGCAGSLPENIHAAPAADGTPIFSGTYSQAWSVSEHARVICEDIIGYRPRLNEGCIEFKPWLPEGKTIWSADLPCGRSSRLLIVNRRDPDGSVRSELTLRPLDASTVPHLTVNGRTLIADKAVELHFSSRNTSSVSQTESRIQEKDYYPDWCSSIQHRDFLERIILAGNYNRNELGCLEWYFDSDFFNKKYATNLRLGALWSKDKTVFRLWAPTARAVSLVLYPDGTDAPARTVIPMARGQEPERAGVWEISCPGDLHGTYYQFRLQIHGIIRDSADPWAHASGVNGIRSMVLDPGRTDPEAWDRVRAPALASANDAVVYEVHVADVSSSSSWKGPEHKRRRFAGVTEPGTELNGIPTGFDHIKSLGVTHLQLLPVFDFSSVDERRVDDPAYRTQVLFGAFNWGYDPGNYSVPEGSYSSDPYNGVVRIRELKELVRNCAAEGMGIVMDVVYNHVPGARAHALERCVPGYYFRLANYSGAGDDTASERPMFRRFMIDSLVWWLSEYKLCGFRFDLMGLHDVETMNAIDAALREVKRDVLLYGEGWDMYRAGKMVPASMVNARKMPNIGHFNDALRCGIKGPVFKADEPGFVHDGRRREAVKFGLAGCVFHPQVHNRLVEGTANPNPWSNRTATSVSYTEIHDNATLYDKLVLVEPDADAAHYAKLHRIALTLVILAQGMPAVHAGMEFMRTKEIPADILARNVIPWDLYRTKDGKRAFSHNTYNLCDRINALDWQRCAENQAHVDFMRSLIRLRLEHPLFRLRTGEEVAASISFPETHEDILAWQIDGVCTVDRWPAVLVAVNIGKKSRPLVLPGKRADVRWTTVYDGQQFYFDEPGASPVDSHGSGSRLTLPARSVYIVRRL